MQAAQAEKSAQTARSTAAAGPQLEQDEGDDLDPNQYHERRLRALESAKAAGRNPYPHKFQISMLIPEYVAKYLDIKAGSRLDQQRESLAGACCPLS
jgi:lysyl-tRNA synthetase class 2